MQFQHQKVQVRKKTGETWEPDSNAIEITPYCRGIRVDRQLGDSRDSLRFRARNTDNQFFENFYDGDGSTTDFTLKFSPIPTAHQSGENQKFFVYVDGSLVSNSNYSISGSTLSFNNAPSSGTRNIRVVYPVIETDDLIDIFFWRNKDFSSLTSLEKKQARALQGYITEPEVTLDDSTNELSVRGYGFIDTIFAGMSFALSRKKRAHETIQQIIAQLNEYNPQREIYGSDDDEWKKAGGVTSTVDGSLSSTSTTIDVSDSSKFRVNGTVKINNEWIKYTGKNSTSLLNCIRGYAGTGQSSHSDGDTIYQGNDVVTVVKNYTSKYKASIEMIEDLSSSKYTGIGHFIYWVEYNSDQDRYDFRWIEKPISSTGKIEEGVDPNNSTIGKTTEDVVTVVIFNAGEAPEGYNIEGLAYDFSISGQGSRWKYISSTDTIATDLLQTEFENNSNWDETPEGNRASNFPNSYPYTFQFPKRADTGWAAEGKVDSISGNQIIDDDAQFNNFTDRPISGATITNLDTNSTTTISSIDDENTITLNSQIFSAGESYIIFENAGNDGEFNDVIDREARAQGRERAQEVIDLYSNPRYTANVFVPYILDRNFQIGDVYELTFPSMNLNQRKMRLVRITQELYGYDLEFDEDEVTIQA